MNYDKGNNSEIYIESKKLLFREAIEEYSLMHAVSKEYNSYYNPPSKILDVACGDERIIGMTWVTCSPTY